MKNIVISEEYNEVDLKPSDLLNEYMGFVKTDVENLFIKSKKLKVCSCPACDSKKVKSSFEKFDLTYNECDNCCAVYVSPRPDDIALNDFFKHSKSREFWNKKLYKTTEQSREEKIIKPRFEWISDSVQEHLPNADHFVDINANQYGSANSY